MYNTHSCITRHHPNLGQQNLGKIILAEILVFAAAKFNPNWAFVQLFIALNWLEVKIYIVYIMFWSTKFTYYLGERHEYVYTKIKQTCENKQMVWFLCLMAYQLFLGYLMPKPFS